MTLMVGTLRGYKILHISIDDQLMSQIYYKEPWTGEPVEAVCHARNALFPAKLSLGAPSFAHEAPAKGCTCGIYAYYEPVYPISTLALYRYEVAAVVEGWGRTLLCKTGFRTQKAKLVALAPMISKFRPELRPETSHLGSVARKLDIPYFPTLEDMVQANPPDKATIENALRDD